MNKNKLTQDCQHYWCPYVTLISVKQLQVSVVFKKEFSRPEDIRNVNLRTWETRLKEKLKWDQKLEQLHV